MKFIRVTATIAAVLLLAIGSAFACHAPAISSSEDDLFSDMSNIATISLYNDPDMGESDTVSLVAVNALNADLAYELEYYRDWSDSWYSFDQSFGHFFDNEISLVSLYSPSGAINIDLRLTDGDGEVISQYAEISFYSLRSEMDGFEWYNWAVFEWLDDAGDPINVISLLTASLPWDAGDMVGRPVVPIPSAGLFLGFGLLILIGRRSRRIE